MTTQDTEVILGLVHRAMCLHVEAVRNVIGSERNPNDRTATETHLSAIDAKRENQFRHLNWAAINAFQRAGARWNKARVRGDWLVPYRRKGYVDVRHPALKRVNRIVSRMQDGLLRTLLTLDESDFGTEYGRRTAYELCSALTEWDYPRLAEILVENPSILDGLGVLIGLTEDELLEMTEVDCDEWRSLGARPGVYEPYYKAESA